MFKGKKATPATAMGQQRWQQNKKQYKIYKKKMSKTQQGTQQSWAHYYGFLSGYDADVIVSLPFWHHFQYDTHIFSLWVLCCVVFCYVLVTIILVFLAQFCSFFIFCSTLTSIGCMCVFLQAHKFTCFAHKAAQIKKFSIVVLK